MNHFVLFSKNWFNCFLAVSARVTFRSQLQSSKKLPFEIFGSLLNLTVQDTPKAGATVKLVFSPLAMIRMGPRMVSSNSWDNVRFPGKTFNWNCSPLPRRLSSSWRRWSELYLLEIKSSNKWIYQKFWIRSELHPTRTLLSWETCRHSQETQEKGNSLVRGFRKWGNTWWGCNCSTLERRLERRDWTGDRKGARCYNLGALVSWPN